MTYLREDIQDFRNEIHVLGRIDEKYELLTKRLDNRSGLMMTTMVTMAGMLVAVV